MIKIMRSHHQGKKRKPYRCWFCKRESVLLLRCNYCNKYFCPEHYHPFSHECKKKYRVKYEKPRIGRKVALLSFFAACFLLLFYNLPLIESAISTFTINFYKFLGMVPPQSKRFNSLQELINYLKEDDLNKLEWRPNFTCHHFAQEFIKRAEEKGYYVFFYYVLQGVELQAFEETICNIKIVKQYPWGTETRWYEMPIRDSGHAVIKTNLNGMELIIDPQTDVILKKEGNGETRFIVLYEGEIIED